MPTNPTFLEKTLVQFRERFPGELNAITDNGGFDAKPYLEDFLTKTIQDLVSEVEKEIESLKTNDDGFDYESGTYDRALQDAQKKLSELVGIMGKNK